MKQDIVDERLSEQGGVLGLFDYIDWSIFDLDVQLDLQMYLERQWLPERTVAIALLNGQSPPKKLKSLVGKVHKELLTLLR